jgi:hypothetical protein
LFEGGEQFSPSANLNLHFRGTKSPPAARGYLALRYGSSAAPGGGLRVRVMRRSPAPRFRKSNGKRSQLGNLHSARLGRSIRYVFYTFCRIARLKRKSLFCNELPQKPGDNSYLIYMRQKHAYSPQKLPQKKV